MTRICYNDSLAVYQTNEATLALATFRRLWPMRNNSSYARRECRIWLKDLRGFKRANWY